MSSNHDTSLSPAVTMSLRGNLHEHINRVSYTLLIRQHHILPNKYGNVLLVIVIAITLYILIMLFGPSPKTTPYVQQTAQKVIVYSMIFSLLYLAKGCIQFLSMEIKTSVIERK